ncbi:MAG: DEAD/DEAH box helicase [Holosporales bacterium]|nr:DEAD/DEAH box helicase [Holosporales bacterium]
MDFFKQYSLAFYEGDFVVHEVHGIALFEGLVNLDVAGVHRDFLALRYRNDDRLYVPVENISIISRYGSNDLNVQLDSLKSNVWKNRKASVRKKLLIVANDLLRLAAKRKLTKVAPYEIPRNYEQFCDGFEHTETADQHTAIDAALSDLQSDTPMDRLVCGDVGFGKTEVAIRAAFIVASSMKQVVLLAPTTILVSQHFRSFKKRFCEFGIEICELSRFISKAQMTKNIKDIESGHVQIVIATHAILSKRINFFDLGLVIIDEEQHFGVKQKEALKDLNAKTHFMTLSATPIPRTLQLAVSGVKDFSLIATPPTDRLSVKTDVCNIDNIKAAIEFEKARGGQIFFVTPRIEFLRDLYALATKICPDVSIRIVHGKAEDIEKTIIDFCNHKIDMLISTNIIDSGIDIPNANTIIIHKFDLFGLSQLYQLRGRVGRSSRQAYAHLLLDENRKLTESAQRRLEILQKLNTIGSGFRLASYDLDIRGAGNLLGEEQSGYVRDVGVDLYQSMLQEAVLMLKSGEEVSNTEKNDPQINLGIPVFIPDNYIPDPSVRLDIYRKIGNIDSEQNVDVMEFNLIDKFGQIPQETKNLLTLIKVKINCIRANIDKLDVASKGLTFSFFENKYHDVPALLNLFKTAKVRNDNKIVILKNWRNISERTTDVLEIARAISGC